MAVTITPQSNAVSGSNLSSYTFAGQAIGTATADRIVVVVAVGGLTAATINSATIQGIAATKQFEITPGNLSVSILTAAVPTGTTGDVVLNFSTTRGQAGIATYSMTGASSEIPSSTASDTTLTGNDLSASIDIPANGGAIAGVIANSTPTSTTWTNLTEFNDQIVEDQTIQSSASDNFASAQSGRIVTATFAGTPAEYALVVAAWGTPTTATSTPVPIFHAQSTFINRVIGY